jgi:hypothetical protein
VTPFPVIFAKVFIRNGLTVYFHGKVFIPDALSVKYSFCLSLLGFVGSIGVGFGEIGYSYPISMIANWKELIGQAFLIDYK